MYIRLSKSNSAKFTKVYLVEGYRDENGKSKQRNIFTKKGFSRKN